MNNTLQGDQDQAKADIAEVSVQALAYLAELQKLKSNILGQLTDVEVTYNPTNRTDIASAVLAIFGEHAESKTEPGRKAITLQMYLDCLEVVQQAGKFKAETLLADKVF